MSERVVLGVTGSIAAYKAVEVARLLRKRGADVQVIMTDGAAHFVTPLTFEAITERPVRRSVWGLAGNEQRKIEHIEDGYAAARVVIAPATANFLARFAMGFADDALTATLLSTAAPVWVAPAMETRMWQHPATRANVATLRERGVRFVGPLAGDLASGRAGEGRMADPADIVDAVVGTGQPDWTGMQVLLTAGPTWEPLDPVRILTNRSTGAMGIALADAAARRGADVTLVLGPTHLRPDAAVRVVAVETAEEMLAAARSAVDRTDVFIASAAVSDYRPAEPRAQKLKRSDEAASVLRLSENPDVLAKLAPLLKARGATVVGFAAETENVIDNARGKLVRKGCDLVVGNEVGRTAGFGPGQTSVVLVPAEGAPARFGPADKSGVAEFILDHVLELRKQRSAYERG